MGKGILLAWMLAFQCAFTPICKGHIKGVWFYKSGGVVTLEAGKIGGRWYWPNGKLIGALGYAESMWLRPDGNIFMFSPKLDAKFLEDAPSVIAHLEDWLDRPIEAPTYSHLWIRKGR